MNTKNEELFEKLLNEFKKEFAPNEALLHNVWVDNWCFDAWKSFSYAKLQLIWAEIWYIKNHVINFYGNHTHKGVITWLIKIY